MRQLRYILLFLLLPFTGQGQFIDSYRFVVTGGGGSCADADANAYLAAVSAFVTPTTTEANAVCSLVVNGKANQDWWDTKTAIYAPIWSNASANAINMKNPGTYDLTWVGSPSFGADGVDWNGTTQYANTGISGTTLSQNSLTLSVYSQENNTVGAQDMGVYIGNGVGLRIYGNSSSLQSYLNTTSLTLSVARGTGTTGYFLTTRTASNTSKAFRAGAQIGSTSSAASSSVATNTGNLFLGCWNNGGSAASFSGRKSSLYTIGAGETDAQAAQENTDVEQFHDDLGIGVQ